MSEYEFRLSGIGMPGAESVEDGGKCSAGVQGLTVIGEVKGDTVRYSDINCLNTSSDGRKYYLMVDRRKPTGGSSFVTVALSSASERDRLASVVASRANVGIFDY